MEWIEKLTKRLFFWFAQKEVKTPLSFFFRVVAAVTLIVLVTTISVSPPDLRYRIFLIGVAVIIFLILVVAIFAWFRPKNLVYAESGHRAEMKFALGTEKSEIQPSEIATMEGTVNPKSITSGGAT